MSRLEFFDAMRLEAARFYHSMGNEVQAEEQLNAMAPSARTHPDIVALRSELNSMAVRRWEPRLEFARQLTTRFPDYALGRLYHLYCLRRLRTALEAAYRSASAGPADSIPVR